MFALMAHVAPLADDRAKTAGICAGCFVDQEVREIIKLCGARPSLGQIFLQPFQLWRFLLGRHNAADVVENAMFRRIYLVRLLNRTVIHPDDDVLFVMSGDRDCNRLIVRVQSDERACSVETDADDFGWRNAALLDRSSNSRADSRPDIFGRLLDVIGLRLEHQDRVNC